MKRDELPIGYLRCMLCGKPALWLVDNINYTPQWDSNVKIQIKYNLVNLKLKEYDPKVFDYFLCDNCKCRVPDENYEQDYIVFLDDIETTDTRQ